MTAGTLRYTGPFLAVDQLIPKNTSFDRYGIQIFNNVDGTVTKMEFMNPHIYFYLDVKGKDGKVVNWAFEGGPPNVIYRQGWRKDTLKPGDVVTVKGFRAKDGSHLAACSTVKLPDGREVSAGSGGVSQNGYGSATGTDGKK